MTPGTLEAAPTPQEITFGGLGHVDDLAQRLELLLKDLCLDLYYNDSHNPGFRETYSEACALLETAEYIHAAEPANDREAISRKLGGLMRCFIMSKKTFEVGREFITVRSGRLVF